LKEIEMDKINKWARFTQKIKTEFIRGVKPEQFILKLKKKKVKVVVDIRWHNESAKHFAPKNIKVLLENHKIEYIRYHDLGNPTKLRDEAGDNFELNKINYEERIIKDFKARQMFIDLFKKIRLRKNYCLICDCKTLNPCLCHRFWLKKALINAKRISLGFKGNYVLDLYPAPIIQEVN